MLEHLALLLPQHLGKLHAYEQALVMVIAFGPFVVLGVVVFVVRRRDLAAGEAADESGPGESEQEDAGRGAGSAADDPPSHD